MHIEPDSLPTGHDGIVPRLQKGPTIHSSAWVVPGATVLGDVILEEESSVWYGAVLRGDINRIIIGPRSNVQDNAVVHVDTGYPTSVGELVTIGHTAIVHACKIDNEVLIGMGSHHSRRRRSWRAFHHRRKRARHDGDQNPARLTGARLARKNSQATDAR